MDRRLFIKKTCLTLSTTVAIIELIPHEAHAEACAITPELTGFIPENAAPSISTIGLSRHFHYLHIPKEILENPPETWFTLSSTMVPEFGMDRFFFQSGNRFRQYHCHKVEFNKAELLAIAEGTKTDIQSFVQGNPNHVFTFNGVNFETRKAQLIAEGTALNKQNSTKTRIKKPDCSFETHNGITVYSIEPGQVTITSQEDLLNLQQGIELEDNT